MPEQYPQQPNVPEEPQNHEDWHRLAEEAERWPEDHEGLQQFRENHVNRVLTDQGLGHLTGATPTKEDKAGARFIHQYGSLDKTEVNHVVSYLRQGGASIPDKAGDRTAAYLGFMADTVKDGILTGEPGSVERQIEAHVIKTEDVPESHFELQRRIAREQGHGDIEITPDMRSQLIEAAQADQRGSLEKWVEYLGGEDGSYPDWFKRYTWDSVTKLGTYDKEKAKFNKRDDSTVAPYPEINREALAYTYDTLKKFHVIGEVVEDTQLKQILKEGSFGRLYAHAITEVTPDDPELLNSIEGSWTKFNQTDDPRTARRLSGSLQGHGTGWCTAGESTAEAQLYEGDFYVYYTKDEDGKETIPRVAIRMQQGEVAEVRGVLPSQELEPMMADIASEQLQELPGGEKYIQRAADMKQLTSLEHKINNDPGAKLSSEELRFVYELDRPIQGFGYEEDPRVKDIQFRLASVEVAEQLEAIEAPPDLVLRMRNTMRVNELFATASNHPGIQFSDADLRFIYGLDGPIERMDQDNSGEEAAAINYWHDGGDLERVIQLMPEALTDRLKTSLVAYQETAKSLGIEAVDEARIKKEFDAKLETWREQGVYEYILDKLIDKDTQFSLVITPNIVADFDQLSTAATAFGEDQPQPAFIYDDLYRQYSAEELSGQLESDVAVRFSLMPSRTSLELSSATAEEQRSKLTELRQRLPNIKLQVPSVLDAVAYWQTLRANGDKLSDRIAYYKTLIRHFDLEPKRFDGRLYVPRSYVRDVGKPSLSNSGADFLDGARVAVG